MGLGRFELPTPRLSSVCSNQLSYRPSAERLPHTHIRSGFPTGAASHADSLKTEQDDAHTPGTGPDNPAPDADPPGTAGPGANEHQIDLRMPKGAMPSGFSRKEVIQPQVLLQLPCYDFTPITNHTLGACLPCGLARRLLVQPAFVM